MLSGKSDNDSNLRDVARRLIGGPIERVLEVCVFCSTGLAGMGVFALFIYKVACGLKY